MQVYTKQMVLNQKVSLRGCFDRDGIIGTLELKSFALKIKGLESGLDFKEQISFQKWKDLVKFMKKAVKLEPENPIQLIDQIAAIVIDGQKNKDFNFEKVEFKKPLK